MIFKRSQNAYGHTSEPETPYQRAQQVWDNRMGGALVRAHNWRLMAFGCLILSGGLAGGLVWQAGKSKLVPYVIELEEDGAARAVKPAIQDYTPTDAQIAFHLANFIRKVRSRSIDPIVLRQNWLQAYDYASSRAANSLNEYARENDPFAEVGERTVSVEVTSIVRASDRSFQMRWLERTFTNGSLSSTERWTGIFSIVVEQPLDQATLRKNPLGIYVHDFNWSNDAKVSEPDRPVLQEQSPSSDLGEIR